jgi:hypothetical protein
LSFITEHLIGRDFRAFYEAELGWPFPRGSQENLLVPCAFHAERNPSLSVNVETSLFFCHSCGASGDAVSALKTLQRMTDAEAIERLKKFFSIADDARPATKREPKPDPRTPAVIMTELVAIERWHQALLANPERMAWLLEVRGLTAETVVARKLGWVPLTGENADHANRYSIPIFDGGGTLYGVRLYCWDKSSEKKFLWASSGSKSTVYPADALVADKESVVLLCEGEFDALLAAQRGFCAVTGTAGAKTWRDEWADLFAGRSVAIAYDNDDPGRTGAAKVAESLLETASGVRILPALVDKPGGDVTDYFMSGEPDLKSIIEKVSEVPGKGLRAKPASVAVAEGDEPGVPLAEDISAIEGSKKGSPRLKATAIYGLVYRYLTKNGNFYVDVNQQTTDEDCVFYFQSDSYSLNDLTTPDFNAMLNLVTGINPTEPLFKSIKADLHMRAVRDRSNRVTIYNTAYYSEGRKRQYVYKGDNRVFVMDGEHITEANNGVDGVLFRKPEKPDVLPADLDYQGAPLLEMFGELKLDDGELTEAEQRLLLMIYTIAMLFPQLQPTRLIAVLVGEQGSGKSFTGRRIGQLFCGPTWDVTTMDEGKKDDFSLLLTRRFVVCADNVDSKLPWIHDVLACAATGAELSKRKLYSNNSFVNGRVESFLFLTTRQPRWLKRDDVVQRCLPIAFKKRPDRFEAQGVLNKREAAMRPARIGHLLDVCNRVVKLLREERVPQPTSLRIADFAILGGLIAEAMGLRAEFDVAVEKLPREQRKFLAADHPIIEELHEYLLQGHYNEWIDAAELYAKLAESGGWDRFNGIKSAKFMMQRMDELKDEIEKYVGPYEMDRHSQTHRRRYRFALNRDDLTVRPSEAGSEDLPF